jgi:ribonuclease BN (tRNA processing enzyme)
MSDGTLALRFLGVGNAHAQDLGCSAAVIERGAEPLLLIDCGPDTVAEFTRQYGGRLPRAVFITHTHMDHVGGMENLFYRGIFRQEYAGRIRLFVPVKLVEVLHRRVADYPGVLAEGGTNFWDCFQLVPVSERFWHADLGFQVFPVRHHEYLSAYGLAVEGQFLYTGDTRPIPEVLDRFAASGETIFHDCCMAENPAHTGVHELARHYSAAQLGRLVLYHYESERAAAYMEHLGYRVARRLERVVLAESAAQDGAGPALPAARRDDALQ